METGIDILNAGLGHMEVRFDGKDAVEQERAKRIITDMLKRGYALFIEGTDGKMVRVDKFDPEKFCYIVGDGATVPPEACEPFETQSDSPGREATQEPQEQKRGRGRPRGVRVAAGKVKVTAVGRSAGG